MPSQNSASDPQIEAKFQEGLALHHIGQLEQAQAKYYEVLKFRPQHFDALHLLGVIAGQSRRPAEAVQLISDAIEINPSNALTYANRGKALNDLKRHHSAVDNYDKAIALKPDYANAYVNRGIALSELKLHQAALDSYDRAIVINPASADAYLNRGNTLVEMSLHQAAIDSYDKAISIKPGSDFWHGLLLSTKMQICNWLDAEAQIVELMKQIQRNGKVITPFSLLALTSSLPIQRMAATTWVNAKYPTSPELGDISKHRKKQKIRLGYFSMDFKNHAVSFLTAELFETHDRDRFEVYAFSFGPNSGDEMRKRLEIAFDQFIDVGNKSDQEIAVMTRNLGIDIAIDLAGFTSGSRTGIFSYRAAPTQVNYLGYPGSMSAPYIDYIVADTTLIPCNSNQYYSEKIVCLPNSYMVNDSTRCISDKEFSREELGLPQSGFVFCCFNNSYKITPDTFTGWMRILKQVSGSVLWLAQGNEASATNLKNEALLRDIDPGRLIFAQRMASMEDHLARHRAADLFLDTLPYNAHTTASDALWAGLPVLTCLGEAFASRVAASLLTAIKLPELITTTQADYETLAIELATNPEKLKIIRQKLDSNRLTTPLFDTKLFTRHIEDAYTQMHQRYLSDLPPDHLHIGR